MARYTGPACRLCRREGVKLFLKGDRCYSDKCALARRAQAPGQHGTSRKKVGEYGMQLREKQKAKRYYGVPEKQFSNYFKIAEKKEGQTGENLLILLERRLDNVVYRMGLAESRREARQLVRHGHFTINGHRADIPSILCNAEDVVALKDKSKASEKFKSILTNIDNKLFPKWLEVDKENLSAKLIALPQRSDVDFEFTESLIVELYSK